MSGSSFVRSFFLITSIVLMLGLSFPPACHGGTFIHAPNRVDMVHDPVRNILYITSGSDVLRYHLESQQFLTPFNLGGTLKGIDLSPDSRLLAVADDSFAGIHMVDLQTGLDSTVKFQPDFVEEGGFSVAFDREGHVLIGTIGRDASLRRYNPITGVATTLLPEICGNAMLSPNASGDVISFSESGRSDGPWGRYRLGDGNIEERTGYAKGTAAFNYETGISRNSDQFAIVHTRGASIYNEAFLKVMTLGETSSQPIGVVYDPSKNIVYFSWSGTQEVRAFETINFDQTATYDLGFTFKNSDSAFTEGRLKISRDGSMLFATVGEGIRYVNLAADASPACQLMIQTAGTGKGLIASFPGGIYCPSECSANYVTGQQVVLTAAPGDGSQFTGWSGSGCSGTGTCTVTLDQAKMVTAVFDASADRDQKAGILIPSPNPADMVHDPIRNIVYIVSGPDILRYHLDAQVFLSPFHLQGILKGIDLSPDSSTLVVANNSFMGIHLVDLQTGNNQKIIFQSVDEIDEKGISSVAFDRDGNVLAGGISDWAPLRKYNTLTGETTIVLRRISGPSMLSPNASGSIIGFAGRNISWGRYRASDNSAVEREGYTDGTGAYNYEVGTSRNGDQFSILHNQGASIYNKDFLKIMTMGQALSQPVGVVYHPTRDVVFFAWSGTQEVFAFDTNHYSKIATYKMAYPFQDVLYQGPAEMSYKPGRLKSSRDGGLLFVLVGSGVRYIDTVTGMSPTYELKVEIEGAGTGSITSNPAAIHCPSVCSAGYTPGQKVTLQAASPTKGTKFMGWSGAGCIGAGTCTVTMDAVKRVTANFGFTKSDVDGSEKIDLSDAILALQFAAGIQPNRQIYGQADVDGDRKLGLAEAIFALQTLAGLRETYYKASDYIPLNVGDWWEYYLNTPANFLRQDVSGIKMIGDVATKILVNQDGNKLYLTSDDHGVMLHGQYNAFSDAEILFDSPVSLMPNNAKIGATVVSESGYAMTYAGYVYHVGLTATYSILALEDVQTDHTLLRDCLKVSSKIDRTGLETGDAFPGATNYTWYCKGLGGVKEVIQNKGTYLHKKASINGVLLTF